MMEESRLLSPLERAALDLVISAASAPGVQVLGHQAPFVRVVGGRPTLLDLKVTGDVAAADLGDGPLPVRAIVESSAGHPDGEILVWTSSGYLSGLEYAWFTDEAPTEFPSADRIRVVEHD